MFVRNVTLLLLAACLGMPAAEDPVIRIPYAKLLHRVDPVYPEIAQKARIQGSVVFQATIGRDGHIEQLRLESGHRLLVPAARDAARQWIYEPTLLNGKPVRVITNIRVQFRLDRTGKPDRGPESRDKIAS